MFDNGYVQQTQEVVYGYQADTALRGAQARRTAERLLVGTAIAVLLKRARDARKRDPRF